MIISISTYNAHTEPLLKNLRILKIQHILILQTVKCTTNIETINFPHIYKIGHYKQIKKYTITIHAMQMSYTHIELFTCLQKSVSDIT